MFGWFKKKPKKPYEPPVRSHPRVTSPMPESRLATTDEPTKPYPASFDPTSINREDASE